MQQSKNLELIQKDSIFSPSDQKPAFSKKGTTLAAGLAIGFFLGQLLALARFLMKQSNLAGGD